MNGVSPVCIYICTFATQSMNIPKALHNLSLQQKLTHTKDEQRNKWTLDGFSSVCILICTLQVRTDLGANIKEMMCRKIYGKI